MIDRPPTKLYPDDKQQHVMALILFFLQRLYKIPLFVSQLNSLSPRIGSRNFLLTSFVNTKSNLPQILILQKIESIQNWWVAIYVLYNIIRMRGKIPLVRWQFQSYSETIPAMTFPGCCCCCGCRRERDWMWSLGDDGWRASSRYAQHPTLLALISDKRIASFNSTIFIWNRSAQDVV